MFHRIFTFTLPAFTLLMSGWFSGQAVAQSTTLNYTGGLQSYPVPAGVTKVTIDASGAAGGSVTGRGAGGSGARLVASFTVTPGETLNVVVGGTGAPDSGQAGGGGGSFVYRAANAAGLLVAAAGGGGAYGNTGGSAGSATTTAADGGGSSPGVGGAAGTGGNGGAAGSGISCPGGGGGGLLTDGGGAGGQALANGAGGSGGGPNGVAGGFGGGGGSSLCGLAGGAGAGGGGGFNGGGGGATKGFNAFGGGGGSFSATAPSIAQSGVNTGNGQVIITVIPADLSITKNGAAAVTAGQNIVYTIVATNNGPADALGVMVSDATPPGTTFVSNSGACTTPFPCNLGTLTNGQSATITATYKVNAGTANGTIISNTATVSSATPDSNPSNNTSLATSTTVSTSADLSITKNGPAGVTAGQNIVYTIVATNNGPSDATSVIVSDATPPGTTFVSNSGACTTPFPCNLGTLTNGQSATITATYKVNAGAANGSTITNTATVSSATSDSNPGNNTSSASSATVATSADLSITKIGPATGIIAGNNSYNITVTNSGPSNASGVTVTDVLPANTTFVSATPTQGSCSGTTTVTCSLGTLASGGSAGIALTIRLNAIGSISNTATVSSATADPNAGNNSSTSNGNTLPVTPAPSSLVLLCTGMLGLLAWSVWRTRRRQSLG